MQVCCKISLFFCTESFCRNSSWIQCGLNWGARSEGKTGYQQGKVFAMVLLPTGNISNVQCIICTCLYIFCTLHWSYGWGEETCSCFLRPNLIWWFHIHSTKWENYTKNEDLLSFSQHFTAIYKVWTCWRIKTCLNGLEAQSNEHDPERTDREHVFCQTGYLFTQNCRVSTIPVGTVSSLPSVQQTVH